MNIVMIIQIAVIIIISIWMHEYAHALVSYKLWDPTPKIQNRLSPNPIKHLDPIWSIMILFMLLSGRWIWWGKPVQINPLYYKKPKQWELLVALAWPATNIVLTIISVIIMLVYGKIAWMSLTQIIWWWDMVINFWLLFALINAWLAVFNLIPIPPLDGFSIVKAIWNKWAQIIEKYAIYISIGFLILILWPGRGVVLNFIWAVRDWILNIVFLIFSHIIY